MLRRHPKDVMLEFLDCDGKRVVDAGCGDGKMSRVLAERGAIVTGIDVDEARIGKARGAAAVNRETFLCAPAEDMPFDDASQDIVVFFNSLHHVAPEAQPAALAEACRVLVPGSELFITEPLAEGPRYEVSRPVEDEAELREAARQAIRAAAEDGFVEEGELVFIHERAFADFEDFRTAVARNETRRRRFEAHEAELRARFDSLGARRGGEVVFDQPIRVNLLRKTR